MQRTNKKNISQKRVGIIAFAVFVFALAGFIGCITTYIHQNNSNGKVNISGRQRFLSAMILLDLQKLQIEPANYEFIDSINKRRALFKQGMDNLALNRPTLLEGVKLSQFANEKTPDRVDIYTESLHFWKLTEPDLIHLNQKLPVIREMQRQTIGAAWDIYTGNLADHFDSLALKIMLFVVGCFGMVVALASHAIVMIVSVERENRQHKTVLQSSSKYASLGEQTVNINHDMNNILSVISTFIVSFKSLIGDREDLLRKFAILEKSVARLNALTSALRRSVVGNHNDVAVENVRLAEVIEDCHTILRDKLKSQGVHFSAEFEEDFTLKMRKDFLYQLLLNLLSNSIEAVAHSENAWVKVMAAEKNGEVQISVIDSGPGLTKEVKEKLFTPFFTTKPTGSGLGLNYLRRMAEEMNCQLIYDEDSPNTSFVFLYHKEV